MKVDVHKARALAGPVENMTICGDLTLPETDDMEASRRLFQRDAKAIADALHESLPGGTLHALLVELLSRKASYLTVRAL